MTSKYPECDKFAEARETAGTISEFLDWLDEQGIRLAAYAPEPKEEEEYNGTKITKEEAYPLIALLEALNPKMPRKENPNLRDDLIDEDWLRAKDLHRMSEEYGALFSHIEPRERLLARFCGIDLVKLEEERRAILDVQRKLNDGTHKICHVCGECKPVEDIHYVPASYFCHDIQAAMVLDDAPDKPCCTTCVPRDEETT